MKYFFTGVILCAFMCMAEAQHTFSIKIINEETKEPLAGAVLGWKQGNRSVLSDSAGIATLTGIADGMQEFTISFVSYEEKRVRYHFPLNKSGIIIGLHPSEEEEEEVVVTALRTSRTISNMPTRTEVISGEELVEKGNMKPGDIRMMLNESTGIQTQQTSATSFNAGIRIQGLDGRYTQILRDGYPLYAGFSGGLSLLQIAPLDLKQVEVVKGSASTLYGGGAIAGLVNLVSKTPREERELNFLANTTSARGLDLSAFYSEKYGKLGLTLFGSRNSNGAFDPAGTGLTAIPEFERYTINPRLFVYGKNTTADAGLSYITENRTGGSMEYIKEGTPGFFEKNNTDRITGQFGIRHQLNDQSSLQLKGSYSRFHRVIAVPDHEFNALQQSSFSEFTWNHNRENADWVVGANWITDHLAEKRTDAEPLRNYRYNTAGVFVQNTWAAASWLTLETGIRGDYVNEYGFVLLPRAAAMFRLSPKITTRLGGGFGYKPPTIFTEEAERRQFQNILPVNINNTRNERSAGSNLDINYRTGLGEVDLAFNHLFFYTRLSRPLVMVNQPGGYVAFENAAGHIDTRGMETNVRLGYGDFKLFLGYTYTDASTHFDEKQWLPLTARHRLNNVLMYEIEEKLKIGLEAYYFSPQRLSDGSMGRSYWITGLMGEKLWETFSIFINFENFTDTRQTKFGPIYTGPINNPVFRDIYAPLDGFVINGGIKVRL